MTRHKAVFNWSGGKDSAHALWRAMRSERYEIVALLTTVNRSTLRSTMHGIPTELLRAQADRIGIPLHTVDLTPKGDMEDYSAAMDRAVRRYREEGVTHFIFGDIFLHDVRRYREERLALRSPKAAAQQALEHCSQSILTSGLTFFAATFGVAAISRVELLESICLLISRGALISMAVILLVLPAALMLLDGLICRTTYHWLTAPNAAKE